VAFLKLLQRIFNFILDFISPPSVYSWQAFVWLSAFSWGVSAFVTGWVHGFIDSMGWIFLIIGLTWAAAINSLMMTPWLTSGLICWFVFGDLLETPAAVGWVVFPPLAATLASISAFLEKDKLHVPLATDRQKIILLFGSQFLLSSWLQFYFLINHWLESYPSLRSDDFSQSAFMVSIGNPSTLPQRGLLLLDAVGNRLEQELNGESWGTIERWLLAVGRSERLTQLKERAQANLLSLPEDQLWQLDSAAVSQSPGYLLEIQARWQGPGQELPQLVLQKNCRIIPVSTSENPDKNTPELNSDFIAATGQVECESARIGN
jgi:hypothetical protein